MNFIYSKRNLNLLCIIMSILVYAILEFFIPTTNDVRVSAKLIEMENRKEVIYDNLESKWCLEIPKINLNAKIEEGTNEEILNQFIGHFEETPITNGNIGLAAHNRGYKVNYFSRIKELDKGDKIFYTYNQEKIEFEVESYGIIEETDWSKLENTKDTRLTLITCVENKPKQRRFVQAVKINMEECV